MNEQSNVVRMALPPVTKEFVEGLRKEAETAYTKYLLLKDSTEKAEREYLKKSRRFRDLDYQLALVDGRLKKVQPKVETKKKKIPQLSLEQLKEVAAILGVKIPVEVHDEEIEELENQEPEFETVESTEEESDADLR